jgi:hypothetical protein
LGAVDPGAARHFSEHLDGTGTKERRDPARRRQRHARPGDEFVRVVEQPLRGAPKGEVYGAALLLVGEGRNGPGFLEFRPVAVIDPEGEYVHPEHQPVAEDAGLAEHTPPHREAARRGELLPRELGEAVAGNHPPSSSWLPDT